MNKSCPKYPYALSSIDKLVDKSPRYKVLSFMDANFSYNQIPMYEPDIKKDAFMTEQAN